jgi:hypothetical protein
MNSRPSRTATLDYEIRFRELDDRRLAHFDERADLVPECGT